MTTYKIKPGAAIMAVRQDGTQEEKLATKLKIYHEANDLVTHLSFSVKPGSLWREFILEKDQVEILPPIQVEDGEYHIVLDDDDGEIELKLRLHHEGDGFFCDKQIIAYWDFDDESWVDFAHLDEQGGMHVWKKWREEDYGGIEQELIRLTEEKPWTIVK